MLSYRLSQGRIKMSYSMPQVVDAFFKRLLPAVLEDSETNSNFYAAWFRKNQISQPSVEDFMKATGEMKTVVAWKTPPKKQGDVQMSPDTSRRNHARESDDNFGKSTVLQDAVTKMDFEKAKPVIAECRSLVESHRSYPHSKTYKERAALQATLDKLTAQYPNPTLKQAE